MFLRNFLKISRLMKVFIVRDGTLDEHEKTHRRAFRIKNNIEPMSKLTLDGVKKNRKTIKRKLNLCPRFYLLLINHIKFIFL